MRHPVLSQGPATCEWLLSGRDTGAVAASDPTREICDFNDAFVGDHDPGVGATLLMPGLSSSDTSALADPITAKTKHLSRTSTTNFVLQKLDRGRPLAASPRIARF